MFPAGSSIEYAATMLDTYFTPGKNKGGTFVLAVTE